MQKSLKLLRDGYLSGIFIFAYKYVQFVLFTKFIKTKAVPLHATQVLGGEEI
jgi:hypothetical protein